jgi:hypothetical protein
VPQLNASGMEHLRCGYSEAVQGYDFNRMVFEFTMLNQGKVYAISTAACRRTPMISILANTIRRFSDWNLRIRAALEQGHQRFFNRNGS